MANTAPQPRPIQLHVPPSLKPYTTPLSKFLTNNPLYTRLAVSAIILSPPSSSSRSSTLSSTCSHHQPSPSHSTTTQQHPHPEAAVVIPPGEKEPRRILLLRRAPTERSFPNKWELPGGSSEAADPTVLHSAAREVFEETGLRVTRFVREVGMGAAAEGDTGVKDGMQKMDFTTGKGQGEKVWAKRVFEVEVVEQGVKQGGDGGKDGGQMEVQLDQEEHAEFKWATSEEVGMLRGEMVSEAVYSVVMEGFEGAG